MLQLSHFTDDENEAPKKSILLVKARTVPVSLICVHKVSTTAGWLVVHSGIRTVLLTE